jgi:hypothetical protein|tara:strand:- start:1065 stop:1241 length:177 start_codon:yes stop_codon:yes gene_type:complete
MNLIWTSQTHRVKKEIEAELEKVRRTRLELLKTELDLWNQYRSLIDSVATKGTKEDAC